MTKTNEFKRALARESNADARETLDCFYYSLKRSGDIYSYKRMEYEESPEQKAIQHMGGDLLVEKKKHDYRLYEEKVTFKDDLFFELRNYSYSQKRYIGGWLTNSSKKTDTLLYYMHNIGLYVFNFAKIKEWILEHETEFIHLESRDKFPNKLVRVTRTQIETAPHSFVDWEELQLIKALHKDKITRCE